MFEFLFAGPLEERMVDRYESDNLLVSTVRNNDSSRPFETAVQHPFYRNDKLVIVEEYDTREDAVEGHKKWVQVMTAEQLPDKLVDCSHCSMAELCYGDDEESRVYPRKEL